jgi:hypothetical protein
MSAQQPKNTPSCLKNEERSENGFALLVAIVVAVLLSLIGLSLTNSSLNEYFISNEFGAHERALIIADSGVNIAKSALRGKDLTEVIGQQQNIPQYLAYQNPEPGTYRARNPIAVSEARNVDYEQLPGSISSRQVYGLMTPAEGVPLNGGRYFARLTDNEDEAIFGGGGDDPMVDLDQTVYLRVIGVHRGAVGGNRTAGRGSNAVAILEATLKRDISFDLSSPLLIQGGDMAAEFNGNSFRIAGDKDHPAVGVIHDNPSGGDASTAYETVSTAIDGKGTLIGEKGPDGEPIMDVTDRVRNNPSADSQNVFDPYFLQTLLSYLAHFADNVYQDGEVLSGGGIELGTSADPLVTVALGDLDLSGNGSGAGVLVVLGDLNYSGAFDFDGIVMVVGSGSLDMSGANKTVTGGVFVASIDDDGSGGLTFGTPSIRVDGATRVLFDGANLSMAMNLLPLETVSLREITPELEPGEVPSGTSWMVVD